MEKKEIEDLIEEEWKKFEDENISPKMISFKKQILNKIKDYEENEKV